MEAGKQREGEEVARAENTPFKVTQFLYIMMKSEPS